MARTCNTLAVVLAVAGTIPVGAGIASAQTDVYKVNYFSNNVAAAPDATIRIDNPGLIYGNLCAMVYVFNSDQQLAECCGCIQTPDGLQTLSVKQNLTSNPLTGRVPSSGMIKIVSAAPNGSVCDPTANVKPKANLRAWVTHIENPMQIAVPIGNGSGIVYPITETESSDSVLGATELANLQAQCAFVKTLGSGAGICNCVPPSLLCTTSFSLPSLPKLSLLTAGQSEQFQYTISYSGGPPPDVSWSSSDKSIVTVSSTVISTTSSSVTFQVTVTAVGPGSATILLTVSNACEGGQGSIPITVNPHDHNQSCNPTASSLAALVQGKNVTAYVPNGHWTSYNTGIQVVPIEPTPLANPASIATPGVVNSCAANSSTGQTVCTANNTDVYLITGSTLNQTLTSGATGLTTFSGGTCANCGVVINQDINTAAITIGDSSAPSGSGLQFLDLTTNTFSAPVPAVNEVSEDILWDPGTNSDPAGNFILSPNENGTYDLFDTSKSPTTPPVEYGNAVGGTLDSAGEDCSTGIALATDEYTSNLFITNLAQKKLTSGSPAGTWTAPSAFMNLPDFAPYAGTESGVSGIAVDSTTHLGIISGEFPNPASAGNAIIAFQLPANKVSGTPALVDWVVAVLPNDPIGSPFSMGCDPHTVTVYLSPGTGKAMGLVTDYSWTSCKAGGSPLYLGVIDLQGLLNAPRTSGTHTVNPSYNLISSGVVTFVPAQ